MAVKPIPNGYHTVSPYIIAKGVPALIEFVENAFGGKVIRKTEMPGGRVANVEIKIGDSMVMMGEATGNFSPLPVMMYLYVADCDAVYNKALAAGGVSLMGPADQYYGDRNAGVKDPSGNMWWIATHIEDVSDEEIVKRAMELGK